MIFAVNGQEGVDLAVSKRPDIILMDLSLPVLDGRRHAASKRTM